MASLDGWSIPDAATQNIKYGYRGATMLMADGTEKFDLVNSTAKKVISLTWQAVTASEKDAILTGYNGLNDSGTYTDHNGTSYTVKQNGLEPVDYDEVNAADGPRYNVSLTLREV